MSVEPAFHRFAALGTSCAVGVTDPVRLHLAVAAVEAELADCDRACSRFRDDSDLTRLNTGAGHWVPVSDRLLDDLDAAARAAELTEGAVDPTVGRALLALGYDRDFPLVGTDGVAGTDPPVRLTLAPVPGWHALRTDRRRGRALVPTGVLADLGATAKARAADRAASAAACVGGTGVLVSLGGDIAIAGGIPGDGWRIRVTDDAAAALDAPGQTIVVTTGAIATSSVTVRRWTQGTTAVHHLVDPGTGGPAAVVWRTVTVAAATCLDANIASTAAVVLGAAAPAWLDERGLCARLVAPDGTVTGVGGWPPESPSGVGTPAGSPGASR